MPLTEHQQKIDQALEKTDGKPELAAALLGITAQRLLRDLGPELACKWSDYLDKGNPKPRFKSEIETLHRPNLVVEPIEIARCSPPPPVPEEPQATTEEKTILKQFLKEDAVLANGLDKLGLTSEEAAIAVELYEFHREQYAKTVHIIGGSITRMCLKVQTEIQELQGRLKDVREMILYTALPVEPGQPCLVPFPREALVKEEYQLSKTLTDMTNILCRMMEMAQRTMIIHAMVKARQERERNKKPGAGFIVDMPKPGRNGSANGVKR